MRMIWAAVVGCVVDLVGSAVTNLLLLFGLMAAGVLPAPDAAGGSQAWGHALLANPSFYWSSVFVGSLCSILGGYVAARIARRSPLLAGALSTWGCLLIGVATELRHFQADHLILVVITPALGALGGYLVQARRGPTQPSLAAA